MNDPQGDDKVEKRGQSIVEHQLRPWPDWTIFEQARRDRVLGLLYEPPHYFQGPGVAWWQLRQHMTGRVAATQLRVVLDELLDDGAIVECRYWVKHRQQQARRFVLVQDWPFEADKYELLSIRGRLDVLADLGYPVDDYQP